MMGAVPVSRPMTLGEFAYGVYLPTVSAHRAQEASWQAESAALTGAVLPRLGMKALADVSAADGTGLDGQAEAALSHLFMMAEAMGYAAFGFAKAEPKEEQAQDEEGFTPSEAKRLMAYLERKDSPASQCLRFMAYTGCRASEACGARWEKLEGRKLTVSVTDGWRECRTLELPEQAFEMLSNMERKGPWIFHAPSDPTRPLSKQALSIFRKTAERRLGLELPYSRVMAMSGQAPERKKAAGKPAPKDDGPRTLDVIGGLDALKLELPCALADDDNSLGIDFKHGGAINDSGDSKGGANYLKMVDTPL